MQKQLTPMLSEEESKRLTLAEGRWPRLAKTILELSEKHPVLPPLPAGPIDRYNLLPKEAKEFLATKKKMLEELHKNAEKWPQYALAVTETMRKEKRPLPPLGASRPAEFDKSIQAFFIEKLEPALTADEKVKLGGAEGRWPDYPQRLLELAHKNRLIVPGMSLPGPRELWDNARAALPAVTRSKLEDFAKYELTQEQRATLQSVREDQAERLEMLKGFYFSRYPNELKRLQRSRSAWTEHWQTVSDRLHQCSTGPLGTRIFTSASGQSWPTRIANISRISSTIPSNTSTLSIIINRCCISRPGFRTRQYQLATLRNDKQANRSPRWPTSK